MEDIAFAAAGLLLKLSEFVSSLSERGKKSKGMENKILDEVHFNVKILVEHFQKRKLPAEKIIKGLKVEYLKEAFISGFNFKKITNKKISEKHIGQTKFYKKYLGMSLDKYLETIKNNIEDLKFCVENYDINDPNSPIRFSVRLLNLIKKYQLLNILLKDK